MRVLVLHSRYQSGPASGENRVVEDEIALLEQAGHSVAAWTPSYVELGSKARAGVSSIWSRSASNKVESLLKREAVDIVHCHNLYPALSPAVIRAASKYAAVVLTLHNYRAVCLPATLLRNGSICEDCVGKVPWRGVAHRCYRDSLGASSALGASITIHNRLGTFDRIDRLLAISHFVRAKHVESGIEGDRMLVRPHFAWPSTPRSGPGDYFLYVGRLSPEKGIKTLLSFWKEVPLPLVITGDGPERSELMSMAPKNVEFRGSVSAPEVSKLLTRARALLVPSISYEGAGKTVLEAYASGVGVIASEIGGLPEVVVEGTTGLLAPPGDVAGWRDPVTRLIDQGEAVRLGSGALSFWRDRFTPRHGLVSLEAAYESAVRRRQSRRVRL